jgi:hypothetical protein
MNILRFIEAEIHLYQPECWDRLRCAAARATVCEWYVDEIFRRHADAAARFTESMRQTWAKGGLPDIDLLQRESMRVRLEIESFYLFTKMQLDATAQLLHWWFKDSREASGVQSARGLSIQRHSDIVKNLGKLIESAGLPCPDELLDLSRQIQRKVVDYRDTKVAHDQAHAFAGSLVSGEGDITITRVRVGADRFDGEQSTPVTELNALRIRYSAAVMKFVELNRARGPLHEFLVPPRQ